MPDYVLTSVNSPTFSLAVVDGNRTLHGKQTSGLELSFRQLDAHNHSSPQCVYYKFSHHGYVSSRVTLRSRSPLYFDQCQEIL